MVGLGRMGANMVRRLHAGGHECVVYDVIDDAVDTLDAEGVTAHGSKTLDDFVAALSPPRAVWLMVPAAFVGDTVALLAPLLPARRHDHRRRQLLVPPRRRPVGRAGSGGHQLPRRRHERWRLRPRAGLLPDDRRRHRRRRPAGADLRHARPRRRQRDAHARPQRRPVARGTRLAALRPERCRPLREDGPQRHRVRVDGRLRRRV